MSIKEELIQRLKSKEARVAILGLGYVGLPLAVVFAEAGFKVTSPKDVKQRGGTVTVAHEHAAAVAKELIRREFIIDYRPGAGIRISPHFYTTDNELELVIEEMKKIGESESYREHGTAGAAF